MILQRIEDLIVEKMLENVQPTVLEISQDLLDKLNTNVGLNANVGLNTGVKVDCINTQAGSLKIIRVEGTDIIRVK